MAFIGCDSQAWEGSEKLSKIRQAVKNQGSI